MENWPTPVKKPYTRFSFRDCSGGSRTSPRPIYLYLAPMDGGYQGDPTFPRIRFLEIPWGIPKISSVEARYRSPSPDTNPPKRRVYAFSIPSQFANSHRDRREYGPRISYFRVSLYEYTPAIATSFTSITLLLKYSKNSLLQYNTANLVQSRQYRPLNFSELKKGLTSDYDLQLNFYGIFLGGCHKNETLSIFSHS